METRCRYQGRELFDQFTIAHDHLRGAIPATVFSSDTPGDRWKDAPNAREPVEYSGSDFRASVADVLAD
jgi:hypothetical protein